MNYTRSSIIVVAAIHSSCLDTKLPSLSGYDMILLQYNIYTLLVQVLGIT